MDETAAGGRLDTRTRLLAAAELLIVREGVHALTIRRIAAAAGANSALIGYHFGGVDGLLGELARLNSAPILQEQARRFEAVRDSATLERLLDAFLGPLWAAAALNPGERALVVVDEIVSRSEGPLREEVWTWFTDTTRPFYEAFATLLPDLSREALGWRLRFLSAAALDLPPRAARSPMGEMEPGPGGEPARYAEFLAFAKGALTAPAVAPLT